MSRIGRQPIKLPAGVTVTVADGNQVTVKGPKGQLTRRLDPSARLDVDADGVLHVRRPSDAVVHKERHGLTRALLRNMVAGVAEGFERRLEIQGVGFRAQLQGGALDLQLGFSHPQRHSPPPGIQFEVPDPVHVVVRGLDRELVGQVAANLRAVRPADPYKGKGLRYEGEYVRKKPGKTAAGAAAGAKA